MKRVQKKKLYLPLIINDHLWNVSSNLKVLCFSLKNISCIFCLNWCFAACISGVWQFWLQCGSEARIFCGLMPLIVTSGGGSESRQTAEKPQFHFPQHPNRASVTDWAAAALRRIVSSWINIRCSEAVGAASFVFCCGEIFMSWTVLPN